MKTEGNWPNILWKDLRWRLGEWRGGSYKEIEHIINTPNKNRMKT